MQSRKVLSDEDLFEICDNIDQVTPQTGSLYDCGLDPGPEKDKYGTEFINFSGGGLAGVGFIGALRSLEKKGIHRPRNGFMVAEGNTDGVESEVKYWIGSSAGSIVASLGALGDTADNMEKDIMTTDLALFLDYGGRTGNRNWFGTLLDYRNGISDLINKWGAAPGRKFQEWFTQKVISLGWNPEITFAQLYDDTGKHLVITGTSLNTFETLYFSRSSYPDMKIVEAVHISISVPFLFQPIWMPDPLVPQGDRILLDGGIMESLPINGCDIVSETGEVIAFNRRAIGFTLVNGGQWVPEFVKITNLLRYSLTFINVIHSRLKLLQSHQPYFWDRVARIETFGLEGLNFTTKKEALIKVIKEGELTTDRFLDKREQMFLEKGSLPENLFIPSPRLRHNGVNYVSDDLIDSTRICQTNPRKFSPWAS